MFLRLIKLNVLSQIHAERKHALLSYFDSKTVPETKVNKIYRDNFIYNLHKKHNDDKKKKEEKNGVCD